MRSVLWAIGLAMLPAAMAGAQLLKTPTKPAGERPAEAKRDAKAEGEVTDAAPQGNAMFAAIDADGDGVISKLELRRAVKALQSLDADGDGSITLAEANVGGGPVGPGGAGLDDPQIAQIMSNDANGDGRLTVNEVPNQLMPMLRGADRNNDQAIDRQELAAAMATMRNRWGGGPWAGRGAMPGGARNADPNEITGQFLQNDRNGDGRLTADELPPQSARMLKRADANNDGALDAGELQAALSQMGERARAAGFEAAGGEPDDFRGRGNGNRDRNRIRD